ncbi:Peptide deformylase [Streptomyces sp. RB5]|uniref:Peptide deformylase n=1 Tax=Streptomyces smaragdinus TaxID=2585196 RepID=A0A7K0CJR2_9ACTN|nr:peptide deformylase [Streptomyces smaragdinus]MQY13708.1 Peptide deformylase [Streptomyces smaragdinus]
MTESRVQVQGLPVSEYPELAPETVRGTPRRITVVGEDILRRRLKPVTEFGTAELSRLIDDMFAANHIASGAAIAANQVDVDLQLFVWDMTDDWGVRHVGHIANPVLDDLPAEDRRLVEEREGCLSVPGPYRQVARPDHAVVRGQDKDGNPLVIEGRGYFARCLQHETDHLYGRLYIDRLTRRERASALREMAERQGDVFARREEAVSALRSAR